MMTICVNRFDHYNYRKETTEDDEDSDDLSDDEYDNEGLNKELEEGLTQIQGMISEDEEDEEEAQELVETLEPELPPLPLRIHESQGLRKSSRSNRGQKPAWMSRRDYIFKD